MAARHWPILVVVGVLLASGTVAEAACLNVGSVLGAPPVCNGFWDIIGAAGLGDEASLLTIKVTDPLPINPFGQNVVVQVCDVGTLNDRFSVELFRLTAPVDIQRCVTPIGGICTVIPVPKGLFATSDTLHFIIHVVSEDLDGTGIANARFEVSAPGWDRLTVTVRDSTPNAAVTALNPGVGC